MSGDVIGNAQRPCAVPARPVRRQNGVGAFRCARPKSDTQAREAFESFAAKVQADLPDAVRGKKIEVWRRHKARVGRQGATRYRMRMDPHLWRRLSRTRRDRRAGHAIGKHRSHDLAEISKTVAEGAHAILAPDGTGRAGTAQGRCAFPITSRSCRCRPTLHRSTLSKTSGPACAPTRPPLSV